MGVWGMFGECKREKEFAREQGKRLFFSQIAPKSIFSSIVLRLMGARISSLLHPSRPTKRNVKEEVPSPIPPPPEYPKQPVQEVVHDAWTIAALNEKRVKSAAMKCCESIQKAIVDHCSTQTETYMTREPLIGTAKPAVLKELKRLLEERGWIVHDLKIDISLHNGRFILGFHVDYPIGKKQDACSIETDCIDISFDDLPTNKRS